MLVTILPFFLAARVAVDGPPQRLSEWAAHGPECTYDVLVNMSLANIVRENDNFCAMIATELKCRPRGEDSLNCRFANSRIRRPGPADGRCTNARDYVPTRYKFVGEEPFEIRFNSRGIENLVVHRTIPRWRLDMIKAMVSQLNVGFEARESRDRFAIMENSTVGRCEVDVRIVRGGADSEEQQEEEEEDDDSVEGGRDFEIGFAPSSSPVDDDELAQTFSEREPLRVEKTRQPQRCPRRTIYFFGNHEDYSRGDRQLYMDMTTSASRITISRHKFVSYTVSEGVMKTANKSRIMRPHQNISLKLKRIDPARSPLPVIQDPASTSLFAFSHLEIIPEDA